MINMKTGLALVLGLGFAFIASSGTAGDETKTPPKEKPDFKKAGYVFAKEIAGEVVSADDKKVKIKVAYAAPGKPVPGAKKAPPPTAKTMEIEYEFIPDLSLVRYETKSLLPKKTDEKGKKIDYTQKELDKLKMPTGVTGYAAEPSDLAPKTIVNLQLYVDKKLFNSNTAKEEDYRISYAIIQQLPPTTAPATPNKN